MTPNSTSVATPGGLDIDKMLQSLATQQPAVSTEPSWWWAVWGQQVFSIESLSKPIPSGSLWADVASVKKSFVVPNWMRVGGSVVATCLVVVVWGWVFSKQYPVETDLYLSNIFWVADSIVTTTTNNLAPTVIESSVDDANVPVDGEFHNAAVDYVIDDTPLSNALSSAQDQLGKDSTTESVLDTAVGTNSVVPESTANDVVLPSLLWSPTKSDLQDKLLSLSSAAQEAMTNLSNDNSSKWMFMAIVYKKSQAMLTQISDNDFVVTAEVSTQIDQLQALYEKTISQ